MTAHTENLAKLAVLISQMTFEDRRPPIESERCISCQNWFVPEVNTNNIAEFRDRQNGEDVTLYFCDEPDCQRKRKLFP